MTALLDDSLMTKLKLDLFYPIILLVFLYGTGCWQLTEAEKGKLAVIRKAIEHRICKMSLSTTARLQNCAEHEIRRRSPGIVQETRLGWARDMAE